MKRLLALILSMIALFTTTAFAEIDLSGMSFEELVKLQNKINAAIWASDGWQSVTVPAGIYKIGEEIPSGKWVIKAVDGTTTYISIGNNLAKGSFEIDYPKSYTQITSPSDSYSKYNKIDQLVVTLTSGYIHIENSPAVFEPYVGNSFSFK